MRSPTRRFLALLAVAGLPAAASAQAPAALPLGSTGSGALGPAGESVRFRFTAPGAGVLTVAVNGTIDLTLAVTDQDGQPVPDGTADRDLNGELGAELLSVVLSQGGQYLVEVRANGGEPASRFAIGASFVAMPPFERPADPDGRPSQGTAVTIGAARQDQLHPSANDLWDWYTVRVTEAATLVVVTRIDEGVEGDLVLEVYLGGGFSEPTAQSDQDLQGSMGNESVTIDVKPGDTLHIKVKSLGTTGDAVPYRLSVGKVP